MAEWISVFCRRQAPLDVASLHRALNTADLLTLSEPLDLPDDDVNAAVESVLGDLRAAAAGGSPNPLTLRWSAEFRPIQIHQPSGPAAVEQIAEVLTEVRTPANDPGSIRIREHLRQCQQVVNFELSAASAQHLAAPIGEVLAFQVAEAGDGLVWFFDRDWVGPDDRATTIWIGRP